MSWIGADGMGAAALSPDNEDLDALRVVTDDKIVTGENAGQNLSKEPENLPPITLFSGAAER